MRVTKNTGIMLDTFRHMYEHIRYLLDEEGNFQAAEGHLTGMRLLLNNIVAYSSTKLVQEEGRRLTLLAAARVEEARLHVK